ncbi:MAG: type II secretion system F family protein, partial [Candidatus Peregrinibacteria bacterium]|nr:type II secretion system F family protein [Candidatus Peregrinibacteria bacterium]
MKLFSRPKLGATDTQLVLRNLSVSLSAGVPLARALRTFESDSPRSRKPLLTHLRRSIEQGKSLADAMESAPKRFPAIAINLVRTGETSGSLPKSLDAVAAHLKKMMELKRKIRSAMMYPTFVLIAVLGLGISIGTLVLPKLIPLFETLDVELPWTTRALLATAHFLDTYGLLFAGSIILLLIGVFLLTRTEWFKPHWQRFLLHIPYIGTVQK